MLPRGQPSTRHPPPAPPLTLLAWTHTPTLTCPHPHTPQYKTREALQKAGLPSPRHFLIRAPADIPGAAQHVGFPAVIKPISGAASIGVVRVDDLPGLEKW